MAEFITKDQVIDWFRCYGHMDKPIPYDVLVTDIQAMDSVDAANLRKNDNCAAIAQQWIPVTERLPKQGQEVIVYSGGVSIPTVFAYQFWDKNYESWERITHWMPMPEPPKEVPENETI